ncbi:MAG: OmpH family outer membrane protein [Clostridium sp.]|nr:OmpH family outer membrane protein [Prevotella sp.]MCM1428533.1 OmpH family outer membrane protein [Clostridium sp.]MCM1474981.1 OmpH family outer membrane protein [Muribaculaceae bacterium]
MMRNIKTVLGFTLMTLALTATVGCNNDKDTKAPARKAATANTKAGALPNYRYIDSDSVLAKYNLSKDFEEQMLSMQNDLQSEMNRHETQMRNFQSSMQNKMQTNAYTEATYKADQNKLQQMGSAAEQSVAKKQEAIEKALMANQKILNDSIESFIQDYNRTHGYDAIFYKGATVYIDPRLDITAEVIEGLNARYNKVKAK